MTLGCRPGDRAGARHGGEAPLQRHPVSAQPGGPPLAGLLPYPATIYRNKAISSSFPYSVNAVPCWTDPNNPATAGNNYRDFTNQTSPVFFRQFGSSPRNQGPYWIGGVKMTFAQFMAKY